MNNQMKQAVTGEHFKVPVELMNEISNYIVNKPYIEVAGLIGKLQTIEHVPAKVAERKEMPMPKKVEEVKTTSKKE